MAAVDLAHGVPATHPEEKGTLDWSPGSNWVQKAGGLPPYINSVAAALVRQGMKRENAIATAVNVVRKTCATGHWGGRPHMPVSGAIRATACSAAASWEAKKAAAHTSVPASERNVIDMACGPCALKALELADSKKPYGDVPYADPGYQSDGKKRYPLDTKAHIRNAAARIMQNQGQYSADQLKRIKARIAAAAKRQGIDTSLDSTSGSRRVLDLAAPADYLPPATIGKLDAAGKRKLSMLHRKLKAQGASEKACRALVGQMAQKLASAA